MRKMAAAWVWVGLLACGDDATSGTGGGGGAVTTSSTSAGGGEASGGGGEGGQGGGGLVIPACGPGDDVWIDPASFPGSTTAADIGTPGTAWQVGTATQASPYVQANISPITGHAFFVFCAGPALDEITIFMNSVGGGDFTTIHVHEGAGGVFGAEVIPTMSNAVGGTWPLTPGSTYVFEVSNDPGSFF